MALDVKRIASTKGIEGIKRKEESGKFDVKSEW